MIDLSLLYKYSGIPYQTLIRNLIGFTFYNICVIFQEDNSVKHEIIVYTDARGKSPLREYLKDLKQQNNDDARIRLTKIQDYIRLLQERGTLLPKTICKHFTDKKHSWLWELRPGGDRVLFFAWTGGAFILLHAFRKHSQKTPDSELHKAEREYKDWIERNGNI